MVKLLLLINGSNLVAEYVGKNAFESTPARVAGSLTEAGIVKKCAVEKFPKYDKH